LYRIKNHFRINPTRWSWLVCKYTPRFLHLHHWNHLSRGFALY